MERKKDSSKLLKKVWRRNQCSIGHCALFRHGSPKFDLASNTRKHSNDKY